MQHEPAISGAADACQPEAARRDVDARARSFEQARARLQAVVHQIEIGRPRHERLHDSVLARMQARLATMPVIEQAKGIVMAHQRCGPDEAFDFLRRASQRANVKVSVLAAQIVEQTASTATGKPECLCGQNQAGNRST